MTPFVLTPLARQDLEEIWDYLARDNPQAAERVLTNIEAIIRKLARTPGMGHLREDLADRRHRFFLVYSYLIVYRAGTRHWKSSVFYTHRGTSAISWGSPRKIEVALYR